MTEQQEQKKPSRWTILKELIKPSDPSKRVEDAWGIMKEVGGFRPVFNVKDLEQRRSEIVSIMTSLNNMEFRIKESKDKTEIEKLQQEFAFQAYKLAKLFELFFTTGSPWVRGMDNEKLSLGVSSYIMNYEDIGDLPSFLPDLHAESMMLLHLAWQGLDVTNTPGYIIQVTNVPTQGLNPRNPNPQELGERQ